MRMRVVFVGMFIMSLIMASGKIGWSEPFQVVGARARGMGGAFVAVADDATASYWNPAAFGAMMEISGSEETTEIQQEGPAEEEESVEIQEEPVEGEESTESERESTVQKERPIPAWDFDLQIPFGLQLAFHENILKEVDDIAGMDFGGITGHAEEGKISSADVQEYLRMIKEIDDLNKEGLGIQANVNLGGQLRVRNFGFSVLALGSAGADPDVDLQNISLEGGGKDAIEALVGAGADHTPEWGPASEWELISQKIQNISPEWTPDRADELVYLAKQAGLTPSEADEYCTLVATVASIGGGKFEDNEQALLSRGGLAQEYTLTYGHPRPLFLEGLYLGGNLKIIQMKTIYIDTRRVFEEESEDPFEDILDEVESSTNFGLDVGLLYKLPKLRAGLVARNLNSPRFDFKGEGDYILESQIRLGAAYLPWNWLTLALDFDLTQNPTLLKDYHSQNVALGVEAWIFRIIALRGGLYKNMAEDDIDSVYTGGLGLRIWHLHLDLAGAMSSETAKVGTDDMEIAKEYAFSGTLSWNQRF